MGICSEGGDVARVEREHGARLAQAGPRTRCRCHPACAKLGGCARQARSELAAVRACDADARGIDAGTGTGNIQIELRRGAIAVKITWPVAVAADCAAWMRELLW